MRHSAVQRLALGVNVSALARELGVHRNLLYYWRNHQAKSPAVAGDGDPTKQQIRELEGRIAGLRGPWGGRLWRQIFRGCLAASRGETPEQRQHWCASIYGEIRERAERTQGGLSIYAMCTGAGVRPGWFYRHWEAEAPDEAEMALRAAIQKMALAHRFYGYRRVKRDLEKAGSAGGSKKVRRLLREDNLLAIRRRRYVRTTDSDHGFRVSPNLAEHLDTD